MKARKRGNINQMKWDEISMRLRLRLRLSIPPISLYLSTAETPYKALLSYEIIKQPTYFTFSYLMYVLYLPYVITSHLLLTHSLTPNKPLLFASLGRRGKSQQSQLYKSKNEAKNLHIIRISVTYFKERNNYNYLLKVFMPSLRSCVQIYLLNPHRALF